MCLKIINAIYNKPTAQHHTKWRTTEIIPIKIRNKTVLSTFHTLIQYGFGIPHQRNKIRARNKKDSNKEGRKSNILIC
jgi:hypothetical protein